MEERRSKLFPLLVVMRLVWPASPTPAWVNTPVRVRVRCGQFLRTIAETQRDMVARFTGGGDSKRNLANIRLDEFSGGTDVSARAYRMWKKSVFAKARLHKLTDSELALVIYTEVKGKAKELLEILEISDLERPDGLDMVWEILDQAHEKMEHERADDAYDGWESARRKHGQSMEEWISYIKKIKLEMEAHDEDVVISAKQMASKMLRGSGLPSEKRAQVLFNAGGKYVPDRIATVLASHVSPSS